MLPNAPRLIFNGNATRPRRFWRSSACRACATCPILSNSLMLAWRDLRKPLTCKRPRELRQECCGLPEAGSRPAARRPDQALWRRMPAPARQFR